MYVVLTPPTLTLTVKILIPNISECVYVRVYAHVCKCMRALNIAFVWKNPGWMRGGENVSMRQNNFLHIYFILNVASSAHVLKIFFLFLIYALYNDGTIKFD